MKSNKKIPIFDIVSILVIAFIMFKYSFLIGLILCWAYIILKLLLNKHIIYMLIGANAYRKGDYPKSIKFYKKAALCPSSKLNVINTYCYLELQKGSADSAYNTISIIKELRPITLDEINDLKMTSSIIEWKRKNINEALGILESLYATDYRTTTFYEALGYMLMATGDLDKSLTISIEGNEYDSMSAVIRANLGEIYYRLGDLSKAKEVFSELLQERVHFGEPYYYMGLLEKNEGNYEAAKELFQIALNAKESILSNLSKNTIEKALSELN